VSIEEIRETVEELIKGDSVGDLKALIDESHPADLADILNHLDADQRKVFFLLIDNLDIRADTLAELSLEVSRSVLEDMEYSQAANLLRRMDKDDAADILGVLPNEVTTELLHLLGDTASAEDSSEIAELLQHDEDSAGGVMNSEVFCLNEELTLVEAGRAVQTAPENLPIHYIYVVDKAMVLTGVVAWKQLLRSKPTLKLRDIMNRDVTSVRVDLDQEEVANIVQRYNLLAVPAVDENDRLVGVITVDDVIDVMEEEATEDILAIGGVHESDLLEQSVIANSRARIPWLLASCIGGLLASKIVSNYEEYLSRVVALAAFIPVILGMGGNVGTQTSTIIIRALALGRLDLSNIGKVIFKELRVGLVLGIVYGVIIGGVASYGVYGAARVGLVVGIGVTGNIIIASLFGAMIPLLLVRFKVDPAISSGPFVTTVLDITGMAVYCNVIFWLMG